MCLDRRSGKLLWDRIAWSGEPALKFFGTTIRTPADNVL